MLNKPVDGGMDTFSIGGSSLVFSATRIDNLGATEYTLVTVAVDVTGSTENFARELRDMLIAAVEACKKSPRSDYLLLRVILFSTSFAKGVREVHGFRLLADINPQADYPQFDPDGRTPLFDAVYSAVGAMVEYGGELMSNDFLANGIVFIITDGADNESVATPGMIRAQISRMTQEEKLESLVTVLIGINAAQYHSELEAFRQEAGLNQYINTGQVTPGRLAKLAAFVSQSVGSQSQAIGTGGPSTQIKATI